MPQNQRESLIYTTMMCLVMVFWMGAYNVALSMGRLDWEAFRQSWMGLPITYMVAILLDSFVVSGFAKQFAFRFLVKVNSSPLTKIVAVSTCMVVPMVILMSLYGAVKVCIGLGAWNDLWMIWLTSIPKNFIMALPFQLLVAGPLVRTVFRRAFPVGKIS